MTINKLSKFGILVVLMTVFFAHKNLAQDGWGSWSTHTTWRGIYYRAKCVGYNESARKSEWRVEFKNQYRDTIHFNFKIADSDETVTYTTDRISLDPTETDWSWTLLRTPCSGRIRVWIDKVRFGDDDGPYAKPN